MRRCNFYCIRIYGPLALVERLIYEEIDYINPGVSVQALYPNADRFAFNEPREGNGTIRPCRQSVYQGVWKE
jgi:hypothetical protein